MIELLVHRSSHIKESPTRTRFHFERIKLPVTQIVKVDHHHYLAKIHEPEVNAPDQLMAHRGECWLLFRKKDNPHVKLPVLQVGENAVPVDESHLIEQP